jgi:hypothetical protein
MFFVNHVLKFKCLAKRMSYVKVDCSHLNPDAKSLLLCIPDGDLLLKHVRGFMFMDYLVLYNICAYIGMHK